MPLRDIFNFETLSLALQFELRKSQNISYVLDESIIITDIKDKDIIPQFQTYLIRISAPDSAFLIKRPRIGQYFRNNYIVAIDLWVKSSEKLAERLLGGQIQKVGIFEFFKDVNDTLEHNNLDGQLDPYPGSNISEPVLLLSDDELSEGIGFLWFGNQDNLK